MAMVVAEERLRGPAIPLLVDELLQLKIMRDRVDHPRKGSKDLADAVCGSVFNAISRTKFSNNEEVNIHTYESMSFEQDFSKKEEDEIVTNMIRPPRMPDSLASDIERMTLL
jgi:hypothetical protein